MERTSVALIIFASVKSCMQKIQMVDLAGQYKQIRNEIDSGIREVIETTAFINGPMVRNLTGVFSILEFLIVCPVPMEQMPE